MNIAEKLYIERMLYPNEKNIFLFPCKQILKTLVSGKIYD